MELDNLKQLWNKEEISDTPEISLEKQKEVHLPLEKIRKNMRWEFWSTLLLFILIFIFIGLIPGDFKFKFYLSALIASMFIVTAFYYFRFFKLYRDIENPSLNTFESLKDLIHQFDLNKQYYVTFYLSFVPFFVCEMLIVNEFMIPSHVKRELTTYSATVFAGTVLFGLILLYFLGNWWFRYFYGKYIEKVEKILKEFNS